jgi:hypothetical protein
MSTEMNMISKDCYLISIGDIGYYRTIPNATSSQYVIEKDPLKATVFDTRVTAKSTSTRIKYMQSIKERGIKVKIIKSRISLVMEEGVT